MIGLYALECKAYNRFFVATKKRPAVGRSFVGLKLDEMEFLFTLADFELIVLEVL